jgi:hypothetical protein
VLQGTHQSRRDPYWRCSIRVSSNIAAYIEQIAIKEHWEVSDLARMLICLGASGSFLRLGDPEASERFKTLAKVGPALGALDVTLGKPSRRPYASPGTGGSDLVALRLPRGLSGIITTYARTRGSSRNEVMAMFLERGLIIYLKAEKILLETICSISSEAASAKETGNREAETNSSPRSF